MSEFLWKKEDLAACASHTEKKRRVLVLYTGGTIGMKWTEKGMHHFHWKKQLYNCLNPVLKLNNVMQQGIHR